MVTELPRREAEVRYGQHDRCGIPLHHPAALRFYVDHLVVPHSLGEMLWAAAARGSSSMARATLSLRSLLGGVLGKMIGLRKGNGHNGRLPHTKTTTSEFLAHELEKYLWRAGRGLSGPLAFLTLDDYRHSPRNQTVVFLFDPHSRVPCAITKVTSQAHQRAVLKHEYRTLQALGGSLNPVLRATIPQPVAFLEEGELTLLLESFVPGRSAYVEMRNSWRPHRCAPTHFQLAREWLVQFHKATTMGEVRLSEETVREYVVRPLENFRRSCQPSACERELITRTIKLAQELRGERLPLVARQGDFWARNLIVNGNTVGVVDWESFSWRSTPFDDLFLFPTSYGLTYPWNLGGWAKPAVAFRATYLQVNGLAQLVRQYLLTYCQAMGVSAGLLEVFFPVFLAERVLHEREKPESETWGLLFQYYAQRHEPILFGEQVL